MTPVNKNTQNLGSKENVWNTIYGSTFTGTSKQAISDDQGQVIKNFYLQDVVLNTSASAPYYTLKLGNGLFKDTDGTSGADKVIIPVASATQAGVITADKTNAQTITGAKIIDSNGSLEVKKAEGFNYSGIQIASAAGARSVWFSHLNSSGTPCINNSFKFDPDETLNIANWSNEKSGTKSSVLHVPHIDGLAYKALRDSQGLVIDDTYIKDVVLTNNATAPYYTLMLGNGLSKANADGTNQKVLLPVAGQNYAGVVTNAAQTIYGVKTFNNSIIAKSDHDFISHSNEFNVIPKLSANIAFNFNYRQKDGNGAGKITQYNFCNGAGGILASISQGQFSGNAATATKATQDSTGQKINTTYIKSVRLVPGTNPSYEFTRGDNTAFSVNIPISDLDGHYVKKTGDTMTGNLTVPTVIGNLSGNASTATKLATSRTISLTGDVTGSGTFNGSSNLNISTTVADDSHNHTGLKTISLTGGNANTPGWRLIGSWTVTTWMNERANFIINSRHTGNGLLSIAYGCNSGTIDNTTVYCDIVISGNTHSKAGSIWDPNAFKGYFNSANSKIYLFWYYTDYNSADLIYFGSPISDFTPANGTWVESINASTYGVEITTLRKSWNSGDAVTGAVWNDYAEYRESDCEESGYVLMETGDDSLTKTTERLSHFAGVSSDTWGFSQGETIRARTPIAVAGRVLVYPYQDRNNYHPGDCVCAAPGGTVDIMTREEIREYPDRIVGTVSCVPKYEEWGGGKGADRDPVKVNGRIWIKVR